MPQFILYIATSLDGYIARDDGSIDWLPAPQTEGEDYGYGEFYASIDALVMGASTYEQVLGFGEWVYPGKPSYVLTSRDRSTDRDDIFFVSGVEAIVEITQTHNYQRVWIVGGGKVVSAFIQARLIDEFIITVMPVLLGSGISLYQSVPELTLDLVSTKSYDIGAVELYYKY